MNRIEENISPFLILGLGSGYIAIFKEELQSFGWLQFIFEVMDIQPNWSALSLELFSEHIATSTLTVVLVCLILFAILHRIFWGEVRELSSWFGKSVIIPFENFGVLLTIAMLGLILGLSIAALTTLHLKYAVIFLMFTLFPLAILLLIKWTMSLCRDPELSFGWWDDKKKHKWKSSLQGVLMLAVMILIVVGQQYAFRILEFLNDCVLSLFGK